MPRSWSHAGMLPRCAMGSSDRAHHLRGCTWFSQAFCFIQIFLLHGANRIYAGTARFTGDKSKKSNSKSDQWMFSIAAKRPDATTPPSTAATTSPALRETAGPLTVTATALTTHAGRHKQRHAGTDVFSRLFLWRVWKFVGSCLRFRTPPTPPPSWRKGVIGGVRGSRLFPLEQRRAVAMRRSGWNARTCPLHPTTCPPPCLHTHTHTHYNGNNLNDTYASGVYIYRCLL